MTWITKSIRKTFQLTLQIAFTLPFEGLSVLQGTGL